MLIKAVLFDMFDTVVLIRRNHDFYSPALLRMYNYLKKQGVDVSFETFEKVYIKERDELYAKADKNLEEPHFNLRVAATLKSLGYDYGVSSDPVTNATGQFCDEFKKSVHLDEHAKAVLKALRAKYKLGIVSNFAIPECVFEILNEHGLEEIFDVVVVSGAVNKRKPSPEIFLTALKALDCSVSEAVFVGDTIDADIEGARNVGMRAIYIERRIEKDPDYVHPKPTIKSLIEIPEMLKKL